MGDDDIKAFIDSDYARVVRVVAVVCGDRERAEDAVQEAMVDVWAKRREIDDVAGWVTTAALNRARSRWRTAAAERRAFERLARRADRTADATPDLPSLDGRVAGAVGDLPQQQREVVALHYVLDMSVADIAARLGVAEGTVKAHLHRGRHALRETLGSVTNSEEVDRV